MQASYALFDTAIGTCGIAWSDAGIVAVQLPEASADATRARITRKRASSTETTPPPAIADTIARMQALLRGESATFGDVSLDLHGVPEFNQHVYSIACGITPGSTSTYGAIAKELGDITLSRAVGQALGQNPIPIIVPCHRVLAADGRLGGFSGVGGAETKRRMLVIEGAITDLFGN